MRPQTSPSGPVKECFLDFLFANKSFCKGHRFREAFRPGSAPISMEEWLKHHGGNDCIRDYEFWRRSTPVEKSAGKTGALNAVGLEEGRLATELRRILDQIETEFGQDWKETASTTVKKLILKGKQAWDSRSAGGSLQGIVDFNQAIHEELKNDQRRVGDSTSIKRPGQPMTPPDSLARRALETSQKSPSIRSEGSQPDRSRDQRRRNDIERFTIELKDIHARIKTTEVGSDGYIALLLHAQEITTLLKELRSRVIDYNQQVKEAREVYDRVSRDRNASEEAKQG